MMLRSYGMDAHSFNSISQALNKQPGVKRRMQLQTFYYKIAADLVSNLKPAPPTLPDISSPVFRSSTLAQSQAESAANLGELGVEAPVKQRFARSLRAIERERLNIRNNLMAELRMRELPPNMCDPSINPFLCPAIRKACAEYPSAAAAIIQQNGLETEQFNALQKKLARNLLFRLSVQREIDSIQKQAP
ncbi:hypothetical protein B484DRAFT_401573 [Ochromonadaceae sp. CCMP2298]|nr:hypothetical protein B484DRAFT_401573 [Ochromonadaceae sp. CCMP2298]